MQLFISILVYVCMYLHMYIYFLKYFFILLKFFVNINIASFNFALVRYALFLFLFSYRTLLMVRYILMFAKVDIILYVEFVAE